MENWDKKFIKLSSHVSTWSKDKNKKVGAVIVDNDNIVLSMGYNGIPRGCDDTDESRYERPIKYLFTEHAERNAIYHAARHGVSLKDCKLYVTLFPCADCARAMIQSGITKLIAPEPNLDHEVWGEHFKAAIQMMEEANIKITLF
jgi:dCMP deaminase